MSSLSRLVQILRLCCLDRKAALNCFRVATAKIRLVCKQSCQGKSIAAADCDLQTMNISWVFFILHADQIPLRGRRQLVPVTGAGWHNRDRLSLATARRRQSQLPEMINEIGPRNAGADRIWLADMVHSKTSYPRLSFAGSVQYRPAERARKISRFDIA
jgi:hypothetical protein